MAMTKIGAVTPKATKPEKPKQRPKTLKQLANSPQTRLAKQVVKKLD